MRIIPAIDLQGGKCVRLYKGDFARVTEYSDDPVAVARDFSTLQVRELHIVDLDGARTGSQKNQELVGKLCANTGLSVQLGGGIRNVDTVTGWLQRGVARCVIGSLAVTEPGLVADWMAEFGTGRIVIALDVSIDESGPVVEHRLASTLSDLPELFRAPYRLSGPTGPCSGPAATLARRDLEPR